MIDWELVLTMLDDLPFLDLHKLFNNKDNTGLVYTAAVEKLGDLTRYYKQFDKL